MHSLRSSLYILYSSVSSLSSVAALSSSSYAPGESIPCPAGRCIGGLGANRTVIVAGPPVKRPAGHATGRNGQEMGWILSWRERTDRNGQENVADSVRAREDRQERTGKRGGFCHGERGPYGMDRKCGGFCQGENGPGGMDRKRGGSCQGERGPTGMDRKRGGSCQGENGPGGTGKKRGDPVKAKMDRQDPRFYWLWSWRESNPRPNKAPKSFLHAYLSFNCRQRHEGKRP